MPTVEFAEKTEYTYAERVTNLYQKVEELTNGETADTFNEFVRGICFLHEDEDFLLQMEGLHAEELIEAATKFGTDSQDLKDLYGVESVYEAFEAIKQGGRTQILIYGRGEYKQMPIADEDMRALPWGGTILIGGPKTSIQGVNFVGKSYDIEIDPFLKTVTINGHPIRKPDTIPSTENPDPAGESHFD